MLTLEMLFDRSEVRLDGCRYWLGNIDTLGYPRFFSNDRLSIDRTTLVHRLVYIALNGPIAKGLVIDHTCHNNDPECTWNTCTHHRCIEPTHLDAVTNSVNVSRGKLGRATCKYGHPWTDANTYIRACSGRGCRQCRAIQRDPNWKIVLIKSA